MSDVTAAGPGRPAGIAGTAPRSGRRPGGAAPGAGGGDAASPIAGLDLQGALLRAWDVVRRGDIGLALGVLVILCVLIVPLPALLLDLLLAVSIILSVLILMTALFIEKPLEFSAFPTVLLVATMLRLALNLASTRLILAHGHEGTDAAGHVIEAFGAFVMGGNFVIGIIVFAILVIVNFVVITKGSGRIAEVAARFTLDAMPGKQMAIDADLSAGLIDEATAKSRRKELEDESTFFGAMDGASKFVRGDAVAGLLIVFVNVIGGMIIGIAQNGLGFVEAAQSYTLLSVGDGLVSQIPALIVSTAAGLLVSKAGVSGSADRALVRQLSGYPKALGLAAAVMAVMALLPGIPLIPFMGLAAGAGWLALRADKAHRLADAIRVAKAAGEAIGDAPAAEEPVAAALKMDDVKIELGYALLPLVDASSGTDKLTEQIKALRRTIAGEMGFLMPQVRLVDNLQLSANGYSVKVKEVESGTGSVYPAQFMVMDPTGAQVTLPGVHTVEPTFGLPATWIDASLREEANIRGYTVVDATTVLSTHLSEIVKANMPDLLSYAEVSKLLKELPKEQQKLVEELIPGQISTTAVQRVLQLLLAERVSIRDLSTILEGVAEAVAWTRSPSQIVEHVRTRLSRQLCAQNQAFGGYVPLVALSPQWEQAFAEAIVGTGEEKSLAMAPSRLHDFVAGVRDAFEEAAKLGEAPVLLTSASARPFVRSIVERFRNQTPVMSQNEIHPRARLKTVGSV
jgi:flagellar biosynthesis protein FlhA